MWSLDNEAGQLSGSTSVTQELPVPNELNLTGVSMMFLRTATRLSAAPQQGTWTSLGNSAGSSKD